MKSILTLVIALALAFTSFAQDDVFEIPTPNNVDACTNLRITWTGGVAPFTLRITHGADPDRDILIFQNLSGRAITWFVNIQSVATNIGFTLEDSSGRKAQSASFNIGNDAGGNCTLTTTSFSAATEALPTGSATTARSPATTTTPSSSRTASGSSVGGESRSSGATSSGSSSASTQSAGASRVTGQITAAGIIGAAMVALLG